MTTLNDNSRTGPPGSSRRDNVLLAHGGGGQLTDELLTTHVFPRLGNEILDELLDSADLGRQPGRLSMTIDAFVVHVLVAGSYIWVSGRTRAGP